MAKSEVYFWEDLFVHDINDDAATISAGAVMLSKYQNVYPDVMPIACDIC